MNQNIWQKFGSFSVKGRLCYVTSCRRFLRFSSNGNEIHVWKVCHKRVELENDGMHFFLIIGLLIIQL